MSENFYFLAILTVVMATSFFINHTDGAMLCPPAEEIFPCLCTASSSSLYCFEEETTQADVDHLFASVRQLNGLTDPDSWLQLQKFDIWHAEKLTPLNLTFLARTKIDYLDFTDVDLSTTIVATNSTEEVDIEPFRFAADSLTFSFNKLRNEGVAQILKFVVPDSLTSLTIAPNQIQTTSESGELIEGLSAFKNLKELDIYFNPIFKISGGPFRHNKNLRSIQVDRDNLTHLGEHAFLFEKADPSMVNVTIIIDIGNNNLTDGGMHPRTFVSPDRPFYISAIENKFEFLSAENFEPFLEAHEGNRMDFYLSPFICDERMRWLRDQKDKYEKRVSRVDCSNDVGKNIFTTDLLS